MRNAVKNMILVIASIIFALLLGELTLRLLDFSYPSFRLYSDLTGSALRPGAQGWYKEEGEAYIKINSAGMRDEREITLTKPPSTFRIAVVGDSYTEAMQVPTNDTFVALLEKKLSTCSAFNGQTVEVLNFGVSGNSTAQELAIVKTRVLPYKPDLVVLQFLASNDVNDNSKELSGTDPRLFFTLQDGQLIPDYSFRSSPIAKMKSSKTWKLVQRSSDYLRLVQMLNKIKNVAGQSRNAKPAKTSAKATQWGLADDIFITPTDPAWINAWNMTEMLLVAIQQEVEQHNARFLLVDITNGIDVHPDTQVRQTYMDDLGIQTLDYPHKRIEQMAAREGIPFLGLWPLFSVYAEKNNAYLHGFPNTSPGVGHWNAKGHALAAEYISARICSDALITTPATH